MAIDDTLYRIDVDTRARHTASSAMSHDGAPAVIVLLAAATRTPCRRTAA
ncbi:hypothetical protein ACQR5W_18730 [Xanthomonas sacchari]